MASRRTRSSWTYSVSSRTTILSGAVLSRRSTGSFRSSGSRSTPSLRRDRGSRRSVSVRRRRSISSWAPGSLKDRLQNSRRSSVCRASGSRDSLWEQPIRPVLCAVSQKLSDLIRSLLSALLPKKSSTYTTTSVRRSEYSAGSASLLLPMRTTPSDSRDILRMTTALHLCLSSFRNLFSGTRIKREL